MEKIIKQANDQAYKVGQLKALLKMVVQTVDEKHIAPSLLKNIKSEIL
ncbi:MAG: hypothetical protein ACWA5P_02830 [bacterium]